MVDNGNSTRTSVWRWNTLMAHAMNSSYGLLKQPYPVGWRHSDMEISGCASFWFMGSCSLVVPQVMGINGWKPPISWLVNIGVHHEIGQAPMNVADIDISKSSFINQVCLLSTKWNGQSDDQRLMKSMCLQAIIAPTLVSMFRCVNKCGTTLENIWATH